MLRPFGVGVWELDWGPGLTTPDPRPARDQEAGQLGASSTDMQHRSSVPEEGSESNQASAHTLQETRETEEHSQRNHKYTTSK